VILAGTLFTNKTRKKVIASKYPLRLKPIMMVNIGIDYRPPANSDGTPSESVSDVLVRMNQLVSTIESMYSGTGFPVGIIA